MKHTTRSRWLRYGVVLLAVGGAVLFRLLCPSLGAEIPFTLVWPAVIFCAWFGGLGPGLAATALSALLVGGWFLLDRSGTGQSVRPLDIARVALFVLGGTLLSLLCARLHRLAGAARENAQRLGDTLASIRDAVIAVDTEGRVTFMNSAAQTFTGWQFGEAVGRPLHTVVRVVDEPTWESFREDATARASANTVLGADTAVETVKTPVLVSRHGAGVAIEERAWPLRTEEGATCGGVLVLRDVSLRRRAEAALRANEEHLRFLADMVPGVVWTARRDGTPDYANHRWYEYSGLSPARSEGPDWTDALHPEDRTRQLGQWRDGIAAGTPGEFEARLRRRDGAYRWFLLRVAPVRDDRGRLRKWFGTSTDIDDLKKAQDDLRASEERYRRIVETAAEGVWVIDADSRTTYVNSRMAEILSCTPADMLGSFPSDFIFPEDLEEARRLFRLKRAGNRLPFDFRLRRKDGAAVWVSVANSPMYEDDGRFAGVLGMFSDITARKRMEHALREADRRKDEFLAMLGHELRNPLTSVRSAVGILQLTGLTGEHFAVARDVIVRQTQQLTRLVDDLLDTTRITQGKVDLRREPVELAAVVARAVETSRPLLDARRHELTVELPEGPLWLEADEARLTQVLGNLLANAAKYTEVHGRVWLTALREGDQVALHVRDTGMGIPAEVLPHVFDLFAQAERTRASSQDGLGIGLALVRSLVQLHGGSVEAFSEGPGKGSDFVVRLPILRDAPQRGTAHRVEDGPVPSRRVLVVDDNAAAATTLALLLRLTGHEVRTASDGATALEEARDFVPDVVLLDIGLPGPDGYEVARRLRAEPSLDQTALVAVTGYARQEDHDRSREAGMCAYLVKPVDPDELTRLLRHAPGLRTPGDNGRADSLRGNQGKEPVRCPRTAP